MVSMTKEQILKELAIVSNWTEEVCENGNTRVFDLRNDIFVESIRVYRIISDLRYLSYYEDSFLEMINNDNLKLDMIKDKIFINKNDKDKFSNKQIIKFIRNAFSHSDGDKELYKISINGKYIEVYLKKTKPIPFHIKMIINDLETIIMELRSVCSVFYLSLIEDNKLKRIYLKDKIDSKIFRDIIDKYYDDNKTFDYKKYGRSVLEYFDSKNISYDIKEYCLMKEQIDILKEYERLIENSNERTKWLYNSFMIKVLSSVIPLEEEKLVMKEDNMLFLNILCDYSDYSFNSLEREFENTANCLIGKRRLNEVQSRIYDVTWPRFDRLYLYDKNDLLNDTHMEYIIYYITTLSGEDKLVIGNCEYDREFIRNAFAHGRWFIDKDNNIILCDTLSGLRNDYVFHTIEKIRLSDLYYLVYNKQYEKVLGKR